MFTMFSDTQTYSHSQTDRPEYGMPLSPFFNGAGGTMRNPKHRSKITLVSDYPTIIAQSILTKIISYALAA